VSERRSQFRQMLPRLYAEAIAPYAGGTPDQRALAESLRGLIDGLAAEVDRNNEEIAEHAVIVGVHLGQLIRTNDRPAIEKYFGSYSGTVRAREARKDKHQKKQKRIVEAMKAHLRRGLTTAEILSAVIDEKLSILAPSTLQPLLARARRELANDRRAHR
jgi:hypothetical protein